MLAAEWKKANDETIVIIDSIISQLIGLSYSDREIVGQLQLQRYYFSISDETRYPTQTSKLLNQLPCEDICIIDQLWSNYSHGRFGFSLQKKLYEFCNRDYSEFVQIVGWVYEHPEKYGKRYSNNYNENQIFNIDARRGHLPRLHTFVVDSDDQKMLGHQVFYFLFQRLSICHGDELNAEDLDYGDLDEELDNSME